MAFIVVYDADVLYSNTLRDLLYPPTPPVHQCRTRRRVRGS